jgi:tRNA pseudouridine13 synthase
MTDADPARAGGAPPLAALLRATADDFEVDEILGFDPSGEGEHVFLRIEKRDTNTEWLARRLAAFAGVAPAAVGFAGLKDRHAVTRQTCSIHLPGRSDPDWTLLAEDGVRVLGAARHSRKLKRGAHRGNRFRIVLREVVGDHAAAAERLARIARDGVPNYFGVQRFGRDGGNVAAARRLFAGARMARGARAMALSAARSELFNRVLDRRVDGATWNRPLDGEVWMLDGSHSVFGPEAGDDAGIERRAATFDIHPTGPLWGRGELRSAGAVRVIEQAVAEAEPALCAGLERAGLAQERRSLRLRVPGLAHRWIGEDALELCFELESGAYATTVLRELCDWRQPPP